MPRLLSDWLRAYLEFTEHTEAPERYHFWTAISTIAGALQRHVWIDQIKFQWVPNFYIILVGPAGTVTKSTTMSIGMGLLEQLKDIDFGPESLTWQALGQSLMDAGRAFEFNGEKTVISCNTIAASEAGTLLKLDDDGLVSMLINMWDGQKSLRPWKHKTRSQQTIEIKNPWLNIICCTTPTWLSGNFPEHIIGGGLASRIVFVYGAKKKRLIAYPAREMTLNGFDKAAHKLLETGLVNDLREISALKGPFTLTEDAMDWGTEWYKRIQTLRPAHLASSRFDVYLNRKQTFLHKIAMILSVAEKDCKMEITRDHLMKSDVILTDVEIDMLKVFESIGLVQEARQRNEILRFLESGPMRVEDLWNHCANIMPIREFSEGIRAAHEANLIEKYPATNTRFMVKLR